ncbi:hypothetical protein [Rahnella sp. BCC 1045]|uniref:hypothetical protein n=1 Tax=Rahnella sp. BCC 1045 TaxID=2816251 RepID=UPI0020B6D831|nr:hypothetical protein [Rahnella sp. BCC 1045]
MMTNVYCKVRSATPEWLEFMSAQERLFANNHGEYHELNPIDERHRWMAGVAMKMISCGELYVLTSPKFGGELISGQTNVLPTK